MQNNIDCKYTSEKINNTIISTRPILDEREVEEKNQESLIKIKEIIDRYKFD